MGAGHESGRDRGAQQRGHQLRRRLDRHVARRGRQDRCGVDVAAIARRARPLERRRGGGQLPAAATRPLRQQVVDLLQHDREDVRALRRHGDRLLRSGSETGTSPGPIRPTYPPHLRSSDRIRCDVAAFRFAFAAASPPTAASTSSSTCPTEPGHLGLQRRDPRLGQLHRKRDDVRGQLVIRQLLHGGQTIMIRIGSVSSIRQAETT
jgi:hypothetical protein